MFKIEGFKLFKLSMLIVKYFVYDDEDKVMIGMFEFV